MDEQPQSLGTYGLLLEGIPGAGRLLAPAAPGAPVVHLTHHCAPAPERVDHLDEERAVLGLQGGGSVTLVRDGLEVSFTFPAPVDDEAIVHPFFAGPAAVITRWLGMESFHAGAVVIDGGAWGLLGEKGAGKSSALGWLGIHGFPISTDDVLVLDGGDVLAGPSCVDLRPDAAEWLGVGEDLGLVGGRHRRRVVLPPAPARVPLRGWVYPAWGDEVAIERIPPVARLPRLLEHLSLLVPPLHEQEFLSLATLPAWSFTRTRDWAGMDGAMQRLVGHLGA